MDVFYNKTVTLWNKYTDGLTERETWIPTVIENVRLLVSRGNNVQSSGNSSADSARLHIADRVSKADKPFMKHGEWNRLVLAEKADYYTLEDENTFFVEGNVSDVDWSKKNNFFEWAKKNLDNCFKVSSVDRFEVIPHYEVWGK